MPQPEHVAQPPAPAPATQAEPEEEDEDDDSLDGWHEFAEIVKRIIFGEPKSEDEHSPTLDPEAEIPRTPPAVPAPAIRRPAPRPFLPTREPDPLPRNVTRFPEREQEKLPPAAPTKNLPPAEKLPPGQNKNYPRGKFQGQISGDKFPGPASTGGKFSPRFTTKPFEKKAARGDPGRQRKKEGQDEHDGVRQLFELYWREGRGVTFGRFYSNQLSRAMCKYYRRYYIRGENPRSANDYRQWRAAWEASQVA